MYGSQADRLLGSTNSMFEKDVNMYGSQAYGVYKRSGQQFEKDVIM